MPIKYGIIKFLYNIYTLYIKCGNYKSTIKRVVLNHKGKRLQYKKGVTHLI